MNKVSPEIIAGFGGWLCVLICSDCYRYARWAMSCQEGFSSSSASEVEEMSARASALSWLKLRLSVRFRLLSASASAPEVSGMASEDAAEPEASNVAVTL